MKSRALHGASFIALALVSLSAASPAGADVLAKKEVDRLVQPLIEGEWCAGLVVGLIDPDGRQVYGYGRGAGDGSQPPNGDTIYEIGSVTKALTGLLLAEMAGRGEVTLDDPVQKYLPAGVKAPQLGEEPITLAHLASHASGLPRMPDNFAPGDPANPYADYTAEQMYAFLAGCKPARQPGEGVEYSNLGMGLLGHVLARHAGKSYAELLSERVLIPLGMTDTRITLDDALRARLAPGHDADGNVVTNWDLPTFAGAGALRSTTNDMLTFVAANLGLTETPLQEAIATSHLKRATADGNNDVALGWHVNRKSKLIWHNGQTGGYHSFCGFSTDRKFGIVICANTATGLIDPLANAILKRMAGQAVEPLALRKPVKVPDDVLERVVGRYPLAPTFALTITREAGQLYCQATGQPRFRIYPESETKFFLKVVDAQLTFELDGDGKASSVTLHQNGRDLPGRRADGGDADSGADAGDDPAATR